MTIAQRFVEMGEAMGLDTSDCKTGNIVETLNAMTLKAGGEVSDSSLISTAMMNFTKAVGGDTEPDQIPVPVNVNPKEQQEDYREPEE